jgi:DNA recombination protein RmuC
MSDTIIIAGLVLIAVGLGGLLLYCLVMIRRITEETVTLRQESTELRSQAQLQTQALMALDVGIKPEDITLGITQSQKVLEGAMAKSLHELNIKQDIGQIRSASEQVVGSVGEIQGIFLDKQAAGGWAEIELERLLTDSFSTVKIRKKVNKLSAIPDAHLLLSDGKILCIDSKFPIAAFKAMISIDDGRERRPQQTKFVEAVRGHINKVYDSYVRPSDGTTEIAYLYIPSERIYQHMINPDNIDESELVRDAAKKGVVICSPSTLIANMHLLRIAERAMGIAEKSDEILQGHTRLRRQLDDLSSTWGKMNTQVSNAYANRSKVQESIEGLERITHSLENLDLGSSED